MARLYSARKSARKAPGRKASKEKRVNPSKARRGKQDSASNLQNQLKRRTAELVEARAQLAATAGALKVISRSAFDLDAVMNTLTHSAAELCKAELSALYLRQGDALIARGMAGVDGSRMDFLRETPLRIDVSAAGRALQTGSILNIGEVEREGIDTTKKFGETFGFKSILFVPLMREGRGIGVFALGRKRTGQYSGREIDLVQTFADQAVIAIENVRLLNETKEALARQTATSDVLKVIASSPSNLQPVFDAIAERSNELMSGHATTVFRFIGETAELAAFTSVNREADAVLRAAFPMPISTLRDVEQVSRGQIAETIDAVADTEPEASRNIARARGFRSRLMVPLKNDSSIIGAISLTRRQPGAFAPQDVELLRTFADQAVIAIKNVRLFEEVQAKTRDLSESLQQQTATADVLKVISRSTFDLQPVLDTLVESAARLCSADKAFIFQRSGEIYQQAANYGFSPEFEEFARRNPIAPQRGTVTGRVAVEGKTIHVADVLNDPEFTGTEYQSRGNFRTCLGVPLLRASEVIGVFFLSRSEIAPFTKIQIELVTTFADQAVIAIENVRLFEEVQAKTRDLSESLQQQTATADVLKVISRSAFDLQTVLDTLVEICRAAVRSGNGVHPPSGGGAIPGRSNLRLLAGILGIYANPSDHSRPWVHRRSRCPGAARDPDRGRGGRSGLYAEPGYFARRATHDTRRTAVAGTRADRRHRAGAPAGRTF